MVKIYITPKIYRVIRDFTNKAISNTVHFITVMFFAHNCWPSFLSTLDDPAVCSYSQAKWSVPFKITLMNGLFDYGTASDVHPHPFFPCAGLFSFFVLIVKLAEHYFSKLLSGPCQHNPGLTVVTVNLFYTWSNELIVLFYIHSSLLEIPRRIWVCCESQAVHQRKQGLLLKKGLLLKWYLSASLSFLCN